MARTMSPRSLGTISSSRCQTTRARGCFPFRSTIACVNLFSYGRAKVDCHTAGGARRNRTDDLLLAKQALSQLSYGPALRHISEAGMVGLGRFELPTSRLSSARSNQLSYRPKKHTLVPRDPESRRARDAPTTVDSVGSSEKKEKRRRRNPA